MHIEILVEDSSGKALLEILVPRIIGQQGAPHTWRIIGYRGIGRLPEGIQSHADPAKRVLLSQLPRLLKGYGRTPGIDAVVLVIDSDKRDCKVFLSELTTAIAAYEPKPPNILVRLAIEEIEAWYLGDKTALCTAYPRIKMHTISTYVQDSPCNTWELLAEATAKSPGGTKREWPMKIGPLMDVNANLSPSFGKFRDGLSRLTSPC